MIASVATIEQGETDSVPCGGVDVRDQRLPQLLDAVADGALCGSKAPGIPGPDAWYRGDGELVTVWRRRQMELVSVCAACPVRAACEESALRQGEGGQRRSEDMVRGGRTALELYTTRIEQARRLKDAATEDDQALREEQQIRHATARLIRSLLAQQDPRTTADRINTETRSAIAALTALRTARRNRGQRIAA